jgi:hypothetical protein
MDDQFRRRFAIAVSDKEFPLLEIVNKNGPCSSIDVHKKLRGDIELLEVMRMLHDLTDRGLLEGMMIEKQRLYRVKPNYSNIRSRLIRMESL